MNDNNRNNVTVQQDGTVSSTSVVPDERLQLPREPCSRNIVYRERLTKAVDIVYTDIFLDVSNYERDMIIFIEQVLNEKPIEQTDEKAAATVSAAATTDTTTITTTNTVTTRNIVVVCSKGLYSYISGAQREHDRYSGGFGGGSNSSDRRAGSDKFCCKISAGNGVEIFFCDTTMGKAPDRIDRLVTFNVDPFEISTAVEGHRNHYTEENVSRLKRTFKHVMSVDYVNVQKTPIAARFVFSVFSLNERALETFSAANNVTVTVSDVHFVLINDNTDRNTALEFVCNYCSDLMLCLNDKMRPFVVDGEMPFTIDSALISDPLNFIKLQTRTDLLQSSPQDEYFRFKQFYHTFVYGKQNKWGIEVVRNGDSDGDGGDNNNKDNTNSSSGGGSGGRSDDQNTANSDQARFIDLLNDAMHAELTRLNKILQRIASRNAYEQTKRRSRYSVSPLQLRLHDDPLSDGRTTDDVEDTREMLKARDKLLKAYSACPLLTNGVDVRAITALAADEDNGYGGGGLALLKRDHRQLVASAIATGRRRPTDIVSAEHDPQESYKGTGAYAATNVYDTMTYPHGGDLCDTNVLNALLASEMAVTSCVVLQNRLPEPSNSRLSYNGFLDSVLFADNLHHLDNDDDSNE